MEKSPIKLFIAEDHTLVVQGYQQLLATTNDVKIVATSGTYYDIMHKLKAYPSDVLLLDLSMPLVYKNGRTQLSGLDILEFIQKEKIRLYTLVASSHSDYEIIRRAINLGATGYVFKNISYEELLEAIRTVASGKSYFHREVINILEEKRQDDTGLAACVVKITPREKEVVAALSRGEKAEDIAESLGLTRYTIEEYKKNLLKKFKAKNAAHLIKIACDLNLI
jgi:DNA-binding NarL/FixJ family response regulator